MPRESAGTAPRAYGRDQGRGAPAAGLGDLRLLGRLLRLARPYWIHLGLLFAVNLLAAPLTLLIPLPLKIAVDNVLGAEPLPEFLGAFFSDSVLDSDPALLVLVAGLVVAIAVLSQLRALAAVTLKAWTGERLVLRFRSMLFGHTQRLSMGFHTARGGADSLYRIQYDATSIEGVAVTGIIPLVSAAITLAAMGWITIQIDWQLAMVGLSITPLVVLATIVFRPRLRAQWTETKEIESSVLGIVDEVYQTIRVVKAFGGEGREEDRFRDRAKRGVNVKVRAHMLEGIYGLILGVIVGVGTAAVLYLGVTHVQRGVLTLGELMLVMMYLGMFYQPLEMIVTKIGALQNAFASAGRAFELLEEEPEVVERPHAISLDRARGEFLFEGVGYTYPDGEQALTAVDLHVLAGSQVGICGETGAGKTTLVGLLPRFHDPGRGRILLDGIDLREYGLADLRRQFSIVLQEPVLFSTSIRENIAYGRPSADHPEIEEAARRANAHEFIGRLPRGYDTPVGARGTRLSGGQRQLVSIARSFLRDAPILILDEPTSSVDAETEGAVMEALARLVESRTTFMISHRLYTLEGCDQVVVLERGRLRLGDPALSLSPRARR